MRVCGKYFRRSVNKRRGRQHGLWTGECDHEPYLGAVKKSECPPNEKGDDYALASGSGSGSLWSTWEAFDVGYPFIWRAVVVRSALVALVGQGDQGV